MLSLVRSIKNTFAFIDQIPSEILSLIPDHLGKYDTGLVELTHKTLTYIERSKSFPLDIRLQRLNGESYCDDAFLLLAPHVYRLNSLTVEGTADIMPDLIRQFSHPTPPHS